MDRFQFSLLGLSAEEERMRLVSSCACEPTLLRRLAQQGGAPKLLLRVLCFMMCAYKGCYEARCACAASRVLLSLSGVPRTA